MRPHPGYPAGRIGTALGWIKAVLDATALTRPLIAGQARLRSGNYIRAINYHDVAARHADGFRDHLQFFRTRFSPVTRDDLGRFLAGDPWSGDKPGLIISFDDGLRSHFEVAAPLLEEFGFTGWFFPPTDFIECPVADQVDYAQEHLIDADPEARRGERIAMTWDELATLATHHVVGGHTRSHCRLGESCSDRRLEHEIVGGKAVLEEGIGRPTDVFCWVGGEESSYSQRAASWIRRAGYRLSFMTNSAPILPDTPPLQLQRINVEAGWSVDWAAFQICGVLDLLYTGKRRRVLRKTRT